MDAEQLRRDAGLELRRERRDQPGLVEGGIPERLRPERVEPGSQMAVHPVRLDERHRGCDATEERLVDLARDRRGRHGLGGRGRLGRGGRMAVAAVERLQQAEQSGMRGNELAVAALEQLAPFGRDGVGILEIVLEQKPGVARVQPVDVVRAHTVCCTNVRGPSTGDSL